MLAAGSYLLSSFSFAHHGWSFFDTNQPYYLTGTISEVSWRNPHPEVELEVSEIGNVPRSVQTLDVPDELEALGEYGAILAGLRVPEDVVGTWTVVLAPTNRLQSWGMAEAPQVGSTMSLIGYVACSEDREIRPDLVILGERSVRQRSVTLPAQSCGG